MFTPPEIPLSGYNPPSTEAFLPPSKTSSMYPHQYENTYAPPSHPAPDFYKPSAAPDFYKPSAAPDFYKPSAACGPPAQPPPSFRKIDPSQVYTAQFPVHNFTPKPFTPSPISQEKLAIFEPERRLQQPVIRRPLTVPNQRISNVSPTPFSGSPYDSHSNAPWYVNVSLLIWEQKIPRFGVILFNSFCICFCQVCPTIESFVEFVWITAVKLQYAANFTNFIV